MKNEAQCQAEICEEYMSTVLQKWWHILSSEMLGKLWWCCRLGGDHCLTGSDNVSVLGPHIVSRSLTWVTNAKF